MKAWLAADMDRATPYDYRILQLTPPGSGSTVLFGQDITTAAPSSARGMHFVVSDVLAARDTLIRRGAMGVRVRTLRSAGEGDEGFPYLLLHSGTTVGGAWPCPRLRRLVSRIVGFHSTP